MRRLLFLFVVVLVCTCTVSGAYASTDCERWVGEYKQTLLKNRNARRLRLAQLRLQRKLSGIVYHPKPRPVHRIPQKPRMGPLEALRRFELECGDTTPRNVTFDIVSTPTDGFLVPVDVPPPPVSLNTVSYPVATNLIPPIPGPTPNTPIPAPVPEPSSILLVATGLIGMTAIMRRRPVPLRQAC